MGNSPSGDDVTPQTSTPDVQAQPESNVYPGWGPRIDCPKYGLYGAKSCGTDREYKDGLCYLKPKSGFTCNVTVCTYGSLRSEIGTVPDQCPPGYIFRNGKCWPYCPSGYEDSLLTCKKIYFTEHQFQ
jgi:hypothetical protein